MTKKKIMKSRGTATVWDDNTICFVPQAEGMPQHQVVRETKTSKLYRTTSVNKPKIVAHLTALSDSPSAISDLYRQLDELTAELEDTPQGKKKYYRGGNCRRLMRECGAEVTVREDSLEVSLQISLREYPDYKERFYSQINEVSKCLAYNKDFLSQRLRSLVSNGSK